MGIGNNLSTKDIVIKVLSYEWPLSSKQICIKVNYESSRPVSYQAVHKLITKLVEESILKRDGLKISLNERWITSIKQNATELEKCYSGKNARRFSNLFSCGVCQIELCGIVELANFLINDIKEFPNPLNKPNIGLTALVYSLVGISDELCNSLREYYKKIDNYFFVNEMNLLDEVFAKTLIDFGAKKVEVREYPAAFLQDIFVVGEYIFHIWFEPEFRLAWLNQNRLPKSIKQFDLAKHLHNMQSYKTSIKIIAVKNSELADNIRKEYLK